MNSIKKWMLCGLVILAFSFIPFDLFAQLGPGDPGCNPDLPCPIDGGLSLLIAAGIGIGARKAFKKTS